MSSPIAIISTSVCTTSVPPQIHREDINVDIHHYHCHSTMEDSIPMTRPRGQGRGRAVTRTSMNMNMRAATDTRTMASNRQQIRPHHRKHMDTGSQNHPPLSTPSYSMQGWWQCCKCGNDNNPGLTTWVCTICGHWKCDLYCVDH